MSDNKKKSTIWLGEKSGKNKDGKTYQYFIGEMILAKRDFAESKKLFAKIVQVTDKKTGELKTVIALDIVEKTGV